MVRIASKTTNTYYLIIKVEADPDTFTGGGGLPREEPLIDDIRSEIIANLEECGAEVEILAQV